MGEYRDGKWVPTFGDVQFGVADHAPGELPRDHHGTISELRAEIERLTDEVNKYKRLASTGADKVAELEDENGRYREALQAVVESLKYKIAIGPEGALQAAERALAASTEQSSD